jgi:hypothetical protein
MSWTATTIIIMHGLLDRSLVKCLRKALSLALDLEGQHAVRNKVGLR